MVAEGGAVGGGRGDVLMRPRSALHPCQMLYYRPKHWNSFFLSFMGAFLCKTIKVWYMGTFLAQIWFNRTFFFLFLLLLSFSFCGNVFSLTPFLLVSPRCAILISFLPCRYNRVTEDWKLEQYLQYTRVLSFSIVHQVNGVLQKINGLWEAGGITLGFSLCKFEKDSIKQTQLPFNSKSDVFAYGSNKPRKCRWEWWLVMICMWTLHIWIFH